MRQSSAQGKAHKRAAGTPGSSPRTLATRLGVVGTAIVVVTLWLSRGIVAGASTSQIAMVFGLILGASLVLGAMFVSVTVLASLSTDSAALTEALNRASADGLSSVPEKPVVSAWLDGLAIAVHDTLTNMQVVMDELRSTARGNAAQTQELTAQCGLLASHAIATSESAAVAAHVGQELVSVSERARTEGAQLVRAGTHAAAAAAAHRARHEEVVQLARDGIARLDASAELLSALSDRVRANSHELTALAEASAEIRTFVGLVRKMARQSKLLALNAAMEAARAGEQGTGFAVVAGEVRRLAHSSSDAAERTDVLVHEVLGRAEGARATSEAAMEAMRGALESTAGGRASLQAMLEAMLAQPVEPAGTDSDTEALGAVVMSTLEEAWRGAQAVLAAVRVVEGGVQAQREQVEGLARAGVERLGGSTVGVSGSFTQESLGEGPARLGSRGKPVAGRAQSAGNSGTPTRRP